MLAVKEAEAEMDLMTDHTELYSHRLSDSDSGLISDLLHSQLSSISSQPSVAELSRPGSRQALHADRHDSTQLEEPGVQFPIVASTGPALSSGSTDIGAYDIPQVMDQDGDKQELEDASSLKADSILLDPWAEPFVEVFSPNRSSASKKNGSNFIQEFLAELGNTMDPSSGVTMLQNAERRPQTAEPALPSKQLQQPANRQSFPSALERPQQQGALHGSLTADAGSRHIYAPSGSPQLDLHLSTSMPEVPLGSLQRAMESQPFPPCMPGSQQANLYAASQQALAAQQSGPLQLPAHVQQWLATLARDSRQATGSSKVPDNPAGGAEHVPVSALSPGRPDASARVQEDLKQMRAELSDVKERFAEAQAALEETQQQILIQGDRQYGSPVRTHSPKHTETVSPLRLRALQDTVQGLHAEIADLRNTVYQRDTEIAELKSTMYHKNAELDTLHRLQDQRGNELQAALQQVTCEAGRASQAQTDLMTCRAACMRLEEQFAESSRKMQQSAGEQRLLDTIIAKGRQENASLRSSCSRLHEELASLKSQVQDSSSQVRGAERTANAREAEADALCKENSALKQQLRSMQQDCRSSRGAYHAAATELAELKESFRQVQKAAAGSRLPVYEGGQIQYDRAGQLSEEQRASASMEYPLHDVPRQPNQSWERKQTWPDTSTDQPATGARITDGLIKASRQSHRSGDSTRLDPPWGQPEPVTRDLYSRPASPQHQTKATLLHADSLSPGGVNARYASSKDSSSRANLNGTASTSSGLGASAAGDNSFDRSWGAETGHRYANLPQQTQPASTQQPPPAGDSKQALHASKRDPSQRVMSHRWASAGRVSGSNELPESKQHEHQEARGPALQNYNTGPGSNRDKAALESSQYAAGLATSQRLEQEGHQHRSHRLHADDSCGPAEGSEGSASAKPAAKPYATDQSLQAMIRKSSSLEDKLMKLNQEKTELEAEYARMPSHSGRNLKERKRKTDIELRFEVLDQDVSSIRLQLKKLGLK